jgi:TrmH family RNA methyltransferase
MLDRGSLPSLAGKHWHPAAHGQSGGRRRDSVPGDATDPFDHASVRASMGGIFHLSLVRTSLTEFPAWCHAHSCHVLGTSPSASAVYTDVDIDPPLVILFGEERAGLSAAEISICTQMARIPIVGRADSLNVGVSGGVLIYDVLRRRKSPP